MPEEASKSMTNDTMLEKITRLEVRGETTKEQLTSIDKKLTDLAGKVDNMNLLQQEITTLRREFDDYKHSRAVGVWLYPLLSAVIGAALAVLIQIAITKK